MGGGGSISLILKWIKHNDICEVHVGGANMEEAFPPLTFTSFPAESTQPANQTPHQSQAEEDEQRSSGSLALTTLWGPSSRAPVCASRCRFPSAFCGGTSRPGRCRAGSGWLHRRLPLQSPGRWSLRRTLEATRPGVSDNGGACWGIY